MAGKRKIEVFTAGCSLCDDTLRLVKDAVASCGCEVVERRCPPQQMCEEGKAYGVRAMPTVVMNGAIMVRRANHTRASGIAHAMNEKPLLIGRLAKLSGVTPDTIRFYERSGLLPKPSRTPSGYRVYNDAALNQVSFIRKAQSLGFSLDEIRRIMNLRGQVKETCRCVIAIAEATLAETESKLKELRQFKDTLTTNLTHWKRKRRGPIAAEFCALIEAAG